MSAERLRKRLALEGIALGSRRRGTAEGFMLAFNKRSSLDPLVGFANIEPCPGGVVEGTLNELTEAALELLDRIELVPVHYYRAIISVIDWENADTVAAFAYFAQPSMLDGTVMPTREYVAFLLGAADILPAPYIEALKQIPCGR